MSVKKKSVTVRPKKLSIAHASYDDDFYKWTKTQANLLKKQEFEKLDINHMIEELNSLGNSEKRALETHLTNLFLHLLKVKYQPARHSRSWDNSIKNAKFQIEKLLRKNPSLKRSLNELMHDAYFSARLNASSETSLDEIIFPEQCPWTIQDLK